MVLCLNQHRVIPDKPPKIFHHLYFGLEKFQEVWGVKVPWLTEGAEIRLLIMNHMCLVFVTLKL